MGAKPAAAAPLRLLRCRVLLPVGRKDDTDRCLPGPVRLCLRAVPRSGSVPRDNRSRRHLRRSPGRAGRRAGPPGCALTQRTTGCGGGVYHNPPEKRGLPDAIEVCSPAGLEGRISLNSLGPNGPKLSHRFGFRQFQAGRERICFFVCFCGSVVVADCQESWSLSSPTALVWFGFAPAGIVVVVADGVDLLWQGQVPGPPSPERPPGNSGGQFPSRAALVPAGPRNLKQKQKTSSSATAHVLPGHPSWFAGTAPVAVGELAPDPSPKGPAALERQMEVQEPGWAGSWTGRRPCKPPSSADGRSRPQGQAKPEETDKAVRKGKAKPDDSSEERSRPQGQSSGQADFLASLVTTRSTNP